MARSLPAPGNQMEAKREFLHLADLGSTRSNPIGSQLSASSQPDRAQRPAMYTRDTRRSHLIDGNKRQENDKCLALPLPLPPATS